MFSCEAMQNVFFSQNQLCYWQKQPLEVFFQKDGLENFVKLRGKRLCWSLLFSKVGNIRSFWGVFNLNLAVRQTFGQ